MVRQRQKGNQLEAIKSVWRSSWPKALSLWSTYIKLREPVWCHTEREARNEGLSGSFAMIRLTDHLVVINLSEVIQSRVSDCALQILAHEIGHHVMVPANLHDNARLLARIRWGLAGIEDRTPVVSNLYSDQLINHYLHQDRGIDMADVFRRLGPGASPSRVWTMILRIYEHLWGLDRGYLTGDQPVSDEMDGDSSLGASLIRSYAREWLDGAGRYAALLYPYIVESTDFEAGKQSIRRLTDATECGAGGAGGFGMAEVDADELEGVVDPRAEALGDRGSTAESAETGKPAVHLPAGKGGADVRQRYREPGGYIDLMKQVDPDMNEQDIVVQYYRELALPHLVPFPVEAGAPVSELLPEGTEGWDAGDPMEELDFIESAIVSPVIIPGYTTRKRIYGPTEDESETPWPLDCYIGIDCSGSMVNPSRSLSWPVLAGAVISLSALRAGASVKAVLSGEPGRYMETGGFVSAERDVLSVLTSYLGTGYAFGIPRLDETFRDPREKSTHIMIITDDDIFSMLDSKASDATSGWDISKRAVDHAKGGGTMVLHSRPGWRKNEAKRLCDQGWQVHYVTDETELLSFAAAFAERHYNNVTSSDRVRRAHS